MKKFAGLLKLGCFAFVVLAAAIGWSAWKVNQREKHQSDQEVAAAEFARYLGGIKAPPSDAIDDPQARYRKGHLLLIDADTGLIDEMFYALPATLRAANASDVGTEAWLRWNPQVRGRYDNGGEAVKTDCDVVVYDMERKAVVAREHIEGEEPPGTITYPRGSKMGWGKLPTDQVLKFLQSLPAR